MTENQIQKAVFDHIRQRGVPGVIAFHPKNGGIHQRGRRRGINAGLGVKSGVSDIIALYRGKAYAIELKAEKGRPTVEQMQFVSDWNSAGGFATIVVGLDQALKVLETWGLLRGGVS